ncbi:Fc.00g096930.m01.CDS01 [Cosmosporella sp. VM-42]
MSNPASKIESASQASQDRVDEAPEKLFVNGLKEPPLETKPSRKRKRSTSKGLQHITEPPPSSAHGELSTEEPTSLQTQQYDKEKLFPDLSQLTPGEPTPENRTPGSDDSLNADLSIQGPESGGKYCMPVALIDQEHGADEMALNAQHQFRYARLHGAHDIRLLEIVYDGSTADRVECRLHHVSLKDNPSFTALSYVWGDPTSTEEIILEGMLIPVTRNLAAALRWAKHHWRQYFPRRDVTVFRLWADALCINQQDMGERSHQVQLMRDIYSDAELVMSSMSTSDDEISLALQTYNEIHQALTKRDPALPLSELSDYLWLKRIPSLCSESSGIDGYPRNKAWNAISTFHRLPYWERVWIAQEVVLARKLLLICGIESTDFDKITDISEILQLGCPAHNGVQPAQFERPHWMPKEVWCPACYNNLISSPGNQWKRIDSLRKLKRLGALGEVAGFDELMHVAVHYKATNPRDRVYGLLGLSAIDVSVDYGKSVGEVYFDVVESYLRTPRVEPCGCAIAKTCPFLSIAGIGLRNRSDMPSWVPDLSATDKIFTKGVSTKSIPSFLDRPEAIRHQPEIEDRSLRMTGARICPVTRVAKICPPTKQENQLFRIEINWDLLNMIRDLILRQTWSSDGTPPLQAIFRILHTYSDPVDTKMIILAFNFFKQWVFKKRFGFGFNRIIRTLNPSLQRPFDEGNKDEAREWFVRNFFPNDKALCDTKMLRRCWDNVFMELDVGENITARSGNMVFETEESYVGLGPVGTDVGDFVCILSGFNSPVLLRKVENHFVYIGACFVIGLTGDEPKSLLDEGKIELERFEIR